MPNRILREGILTSDRVDMLTAEAEVFYRRLMSVVDDYGRFEAKPVMLRVNCFPLRVDSIKDSAIVRWLDECVIAGLVRLYEVKAKSYLELLDFRQRTRASKFPDPENAPEQCREHMTAAGEQMTAARAPSARLGEGVVVGVVEGVCVVEGDNPPIPPLPAIDAEPAKPRASPASAGIRDEVWAAWKRHRGKTLTAEAIRLQLRDLVRWRDDGHDPNAIVERSIANGWTGLFVPKDERRGRSHTRDPTLQEQRASNVGKLTGKGNGAIDSTAERMGDAPLLEVPSDLRQPGSDHVGRRRPG